MRHALQKSLRISLLAASLGGIALFAPGAQAASPQTQYQQDVARCNSTPGIDKQACLREAGAAEQAARQDKLTSPSMQAETQNRTQRCDSLPADQRQGCMQLMDNGNTRTQGSVQSGGVLRETTITVPASTGS
ncbi:hypothetical protein [Castellaniella sp.]|uniref:hypothetical protein n=1 Tax=Castellaniella sp. TaxID=1955812 RepID=UPI002AFEDE46|nr:hypothetical protein [Castellaniella sp.]